MSYLIYICPLLKYMWWVGWPYMQGADLKIGKITTSSGDDVVAAIHLTKKPLDLHSAKKLIGKPVSLEDSRNANMIGRVTNVIGRTDEPFAVISLDKRRKNNTADKVMNKTVFTPFRLDM